MDTVDRLKFVDDARLREPAGGQEATYISKAGGDTEYDCADHRQRNKQAPARRPESIPVRVVTVV